jgi:hypothetical protein
MPKKRFRAEQTVVVLRQIERCHTGARRRQSSATMIGTNSGVRVDFWLISEH